MKKGAWSRDEIVRLQTALRDKEDRLAHTVVDYLVSRLGWMDGCLRYKESLSIHVAFYFPRDHTVNGIITRHNQFSRLAPELLSY